MHLTELARLGDLAPEWDAVVDRMAQPSPFLRSWWLESVVSGEPRYLVVRDGDRLVGGLPLERSAALGGEWWSFIGSGRLEPDHLDVVAAPDEVAATLELIAAHLSRGSRVVDLQGVPAASPLVDALPGIGRSSYLMVAPYVRLPDTPEDYLASLPGRMRSTIKRTGKRLAKAGVEFRVVDDPADWERALDAFEQLHDSRWGDSSAFLDVSASFRAAVLAGLEAGEVWIGELVAEDGTVIATEIEFVVGDTVSFYQAGRLTDHDYRGSGSVLRYELISRAIDDGYRVFDLLRGGEPYKSDWANAERDLLRVRRGVGVRGAVAATAAEANVALQKFLTRVRRRGVDSAGE